MGGARFVGSGELDADRSDHSHSVMIGAEESGYRSQGTPLLTPPPRTLVLLWPKVFFTRSKEFPSPTGESPENAVPSPIESCHWGD